jgi:hypothetical protein
MLCQHHVERIDEKRLTKEIYEADVGGNAGRGRPKRPFRDIREVLEKGQVKCTRNRRACMRTVEEAIGVCKDRSKWKEVISVITSRPFPFGAFQRETGEMLS